MKPAVPKLSQMNQKMNADNGLNATAVPISARGNEFIFIVILFVMGYYII